MFKDLKNENGDEQGNDVSDERHIEVTRRRWLACHVVSKHQRNECSGNNDIACISKEIVKCKASLTKLRTETEHGKLVGREDSILDQILRKYQFDWSIK